jgi:hypothetical protein
MKIKLTVFVAAVAAACLVPCLCAQVDAALQGKIDAEMAVVKTLAADPDIVAAVKAQNSAPSAEVQALTQEKWKALTLLDPLVRSFVKSSAGATLKAKKSAVVSEAFLSDAEGRKVAFLSKPSNWSHKGKAKHDDPMQGKTWQGAIEVDESTGLEEVQIAVPVLDGAQPIGSLVVGLNVAKMRS